MKNRKLLLLALIVLMLAGASCNTSTKGGIVNKAPMCYDTRTDSFLISPISFGFMGPDSSYIVYFFDYSIYDSVSLTSFPCGKDQIYLKHVYKFMAAHPELELAHSQPSLEKKGMLTFWQRVEPEPKPLLPVEDTMDRVVKRLENMTNQWKAE